MTLREQLQILAEAYIESDHSAQTVARRIIRLLTETAAADAERERLARIGELVEGFLQQQAKYGAGDALQAWPATSHDNDLTFHASFRRRFGHGSTFLDALRALAANCEVK